MFLVGLTGGIACGKSTVAKILQDLGSPLIDADVLAREVVEPGKPAWKKIKDYFGDEVFHSDGTLNREKLGTIIFSDEAKRKVLNSITHPEIYKSMGWKIVSYFFKGEAFVILDLPLLYETKKALPFLQYVIVVSTDEDTQIQRLCDRNKLSQEEAVQRISAQMPLADKVKQASFVIDNSGSRIQTEQEVNKLYVRLRASLLHWKFRIFLISAGVGIMGLITIFFKLFL